MGVMLLSNIKIHEIAKKLNINSKDVLNKAKDLGFNIKSHLSAVSEEDAEKINEAKKTGKRVIACGTTSCRVLETVSDENGFVKKVEGDTGIFIYPGYKYKCVDALITNFHLPKSTLIMLVSALADKEFIMEAYNRAVKEKYKFFSFGDAMFIE